MKYIILCGGRGERFINAYPKPLNRVCGRMVGEFMIESILQYKDITELIWVLNPILYTYNIETEISRWTKGLVNTFIKLPFETRNPIETLDLALNYLTFDDSFVCLDNDNIYIDGLDEFQYITSVDAAILVAMMDPTKVYPPRYGFVKVDNGSIIDGKEKKIGWGENAFSYGGYWFQSPHLCKIWLNYEREHSTLDNELSLLNLIIKYSRKTQAVITKETFSIGTPQDCSEAELIKGKYFGWKNVKIVTNDLTKNEVIEWMKDKNSLGPEAKEYDICISERAINPFDRNWLISAGDWKHIASYNLMNSLPVTRNVNLELKQIEHVVKTGSYDELRGQAYYYEFLNNTEPGRSIRHQRPEAPVSSLRELLYGSYLLAPQDDGGSVQILSRRQCSSGKV